MDGYWQSSPPPQIKAGILADWMDALEDWKQETIVAALRKWRNDNPSKRPNPGHILAMLKDGWGRKVARETKPAPMIEEAPRERVSPDRAAEILKEIMGKDA